MTVAEYFEETKLGFNNKYTVPVSKRSSSYVTQQTKDVESMLV